MAGVPQHLKGRSFTRVASWSQDELATLLDLADEFKAERARRRELRVLPGRTIGLIFHKPSTRTRVAFEVGIAELGGMALFLPAGELQLTRGESYRDTAIVLSRFLSALMIRTFEQEEVETFSEHASIPVINGLTDETHPLQALADVMTVRERFGSLAGNPARVRRRRQQRVPFAHAYRRSAFGWTSPLRLPRATSPILPSSRPPSRTRTQTGGASSLMADPREAGCGGAQAVYTDVWTSMGHEADRDRRLRDFEPYRIDDALLGVADPEAVAMHCLPAHAGEEITADVLYGPRCLAWEQAENRLHTQKALMALVIR